MRRSTYIDVHMQINKSNSLTFALVEVFFAEWSILLWIIDAQVVSLFKPKSSNATRYNDQNICNKALENNVTHNLNH